MYGAGRDRHSVDEASPLTSPPPPSLIGEGGSLVGSAYAVWRDRDFEILDDGVNEVCPGKVGDDEIRAAGWYGNPIPRILRNQPTTVCGNLQAVPVALASTNHRIASLKLRARCVLHIVGYTVVFTLWVIRDPRGLRSRVGRTLIWGKVRRSMIVCVPGLTARLERKCGLAGRCAQCGASCNILMASPRWDPRTRPCLIYEGRPPVCRYFPMTPADLKDVELATNGARCGHHFWNGDKPIRLDRA